MGELIALGDLPESLDQVEERDFDRHALPRRRKLHLRPRPETGAQGVDLVERLGHPPESLVLEKAPREVLARVLFDAARRTGQEHPRLDVDQLGRKRHVVGGEIQIELLHRVEKGGVLLGDRRDRDVGDRDLVDADQMQEQIERAGEGRGRDVRQLSAGSLRGPFHQSPPKIRMRVAR